MSFAHIAVSAAIPLLTVKAQSLAAALSLPFIEHPTADYHYLLIYADEYLYLQDTQQKQSIFYIDFFSAKLNFRRKHLSLKKEILATALGLKKKINPPSIVDATGGLAQDSFILACLGFEITLIERSPILHALLADGILRAKQHPALAPIMARLKLIYANSITYLSTLEPRPDIIYLDPMFPERKKTALSKQSMRLLHTIVGDDIDAPALLEAALACALKRVVVKRPRLAEPLAGLKPTYCLEGSSSRFDIYHLG